MLNLTPEQYEAIRYRKHPLTLTAAAGSGKTTVLVRRYIGLLKDGLKPREILTVTFTTEAAQQLKDRILKVLKEEETPSKELWENVESTPQIGTIHSFCYRLLDQFGTVVGLEPIDRILSPFEFATGFDRAYRFWLNDLGADRLRELLQFYPHAELRRTVKTLYQGRFFVRRSGLEISEINEPREKSVWALLKEVLPPLFQSLESQFTKKGLYSFDDLENLALKILTDSPETLDRLQQEIKCLLVDEFQDTSRLQWEILQRIVGQERQKLFVVGDPKQSIYGFRNAEVSLFLNLTESMGSWGGENKELTANFRSDPTLLESINQISQNLFSDTKIPFQEMRSGKERIASTTSPFRIRRYPYEKKGSNHVVLEIREATKVVRELVFEGAKPHEIALLFRVSDRIPDYYQAMLSQGIPAECRRSSPLFRSYDVIDLVAYLRALNTPWNDFHLTSFLRSAYVGFSYQELWEANRAPGEALFEKVRNEKRLSWFFDLIESGEWRVKALLHALFRHSRHWPQQQEAFMALLSALSEDGLSLPKAVEALNSWESEDIAFEAKLSSPSGEPGVKLMTVHASKGLEFPHVLIVDNLRTSPRKTPPVRFETGRLPGLRFRNGDDIVNSESYELLQTLQTEREDEESKRILYVALTRAERTLTLLLPRLNDPDDCPKGTWASLLEGALSQNG